jgi:hypothetical protein
MRPIKWCNCEKIYYYVRCEVCGLIQNNLGFESEKEAMKSWNMRGQDVVCFYEKSGRYRQVTKEEYDKLIL